MDFTMSVAVMVIVTDLIGMGTVLMLVLLEHRGTPRR